MSKKEDFKAFVSKHPELITNVQNNNMTWQKYYEIYDLYGEDMDKWDIYLNSDRNKGTFDTISSLIKKVDMNSIQKHINTAQKAIGLFKELSTKNTASTVSNTAKGPLSARPINKFFVD